MIDFIKDADCTKETPVKFGVPDAPIYGKGITLKPRVQGRTDSEHFKKIYLPELLPLEEYDLIVVLISGGKTLVYGAYDDRTFTQEISLDWGAGDLNFTPLDYKMPEEQQEFTYYLCTGYNIDFTLVMALIQNESSFDPSVISVTNDYGYMQINKINHQWLTDTLGVTDFTDPYQNIRAGVFVLRKLYERYQDTNMVLMAYNMGEDGAARLWEKGIYSTDYTEKILNYQTQFNEQMGGE